MCKACVPKKRRNPEDEKEFIRICLDCEGLHLRKVLFEEFWNEKVRKHHEIKLKAEEKGLLLRKIKSREKENAKLIQKKSELKLSAQLLDGIDEKIAGLRSKIKGAEQRKAHKAKEQLQATEKIVRNKERLSKKEQEFEKIKNQKDFYKSQQIRDMHRKQDLKLKVKFFLAKVLEKNNIDRETLVLPNKSSETEDSELLFTFSQISLSEKEKKKLNRKKKKYTQKNAKVDDERSNCGGCQSCRVF